MPRVVKSPWKNFYILFVASVFHVEFISFHVYIHVDLCTIPEDVAMSQEVIAYMCCHLAIAPKKVPRVSKIEHSDWSEIINSNPFGGKLLKPGNPYWGLTNQPTDNRQQRN
jgi:hypothetical protein